jgi:deferrochelatase/peroxidase EfeB
LFDIAQTFVSLAIPERVAGSIVYTDITGFTYKKGTNGMSRDLSDFEDGTENPSTEEKKKEAALTKGKKIFKKF